jgi:septal ring factor EnvC (AmiA/AmiB activator)
MDTTVRHLSALQEANEALKDELRAAQKSEKRLQKQIDEMAVHLGQPTMYKKKPRVFTMVDRTPWMLQPRHNECVLDRESF